ncbi:hypothetical protein ILYODFUR_011364 [Ilyodon furcidens]|uniref:Uncharacterized protein n=2 Tax=Goodeidae TaxID=28758 RepID=A0ABV0SM24_9TELE
MMKKKVKSAQLQIFLHMQIQVGSGGGTKWLLTGSSTYFSTPFTVPVPKRGKSAKNTGKGQNTKDRKTSSNTATSDGKCSSNTPASDGTKPTKEVICADL